MFGFRRREQNTWLKEILCSAAEAIFVTDRDWMITIANDSSQAIFGRKEIELIGLKLTDFLKTWLDTEDWSGKKEIKGELEIDEAFFRYSVTFIEGDKQSGYVCILTDITALRRLDTLKTQMIKIASHDLRSPVTSLRLQYFMLKRQSTTPKESENLERLRDNIDNLQKMLDKLLDIEWIEKQAQGIQSAFSIASLLESTVSMFLSDAEFKQQQIDSAISPDLPLICGDPIRLQEVFRNLLSNAIKYTPEGGSIGVNARYDTENIYVSVQDSGIGIAEDDLAKIFQAKFRAKNVQDIDGKGIGLSLAKAIIEEHGGKIWFESKLGKGTCFTFSLPVNQGCLV
jgi:PAS domain S-box-containing protein